jgi:hypothetical protein
MLLALKWIKWIGERQVADTIYEIGRESKSRKGFTTDGSISERLAFKLKQALIGYCHEVKYWFSISRTTHNGKDWSNELLAFFWVISILLLL